LLLVSTWFCRVRAAKDDLPSLDEWEKQLNEKVFQPEQFDVAIFVWNCLCALDIASSLAVFRKSAPQIKCN
jgi:hypothetical protein